MNIDFKKMLKGQYEPDGFLKDISADQVVPGFGYNILNFYNPLYRPLSDENHIKKGGDKPIWPNHKSFAVCLTHDVDHVSLYSFKHWLRSKKERVKSKNSIFGVFKSAAGSCIDFALNGKNFLTKDPIHCYEKWLVEENKLNVKSTFFFAPGYNNVNIHHENDCLYDLNDQIVFDGQKCSVKEVINEILHKGWGIGLHPSCHSFNNVEELKYQKYAFEKSIDYEISCIRQHHLYYDFRITPNIHAEAGFKYDSTLGFNDNVGFRFGTSYPWYLTDTKTNRLLPILELPLIIQDGAMLKAHKGLRLDIETAFKYVAQIADKVESVGGVLTLLWHPSSVANSNSWNLYFRIINYLKKKNPWFATINEIGRWWEKNNKELSV
jgi:peptidoglycan/xylan/chitin deacetylase (PgdA/CDA1 family)